MAVFNFWERMFFRIPGLIRMVFFLRLGLGTSQGWFCCFASTGGPTRWLLGPFFGFAVLGGFFRGGFSDPPVFLLAGFAGGLFAQSFASETVQVVGEHDPAQFLAARVEPFGKAATGLGVVGDDDAEACFDLGSAFLAGGEGGVF
jgi:hypothetical protein